MKIAKKLILSNILVTTMAMIVLAIFISIVVSEYIKEDVAKEIVRENNMLVQMVGNGRFARQDINPIINLPSNRGMQSPPVIYAIYDISEVPKLVTSSFPGMVGKAQAQNIYADIANKSTQKIYQVRLWERELLAYNQSVSVNFGNKDTSYLVFTAVANNDINTIIRRIIVGLLVLLGIINLIIVIISRYWAHKITKHIETLVETAQRFSLRRFDEKAKVDSKDELQLLAEAMNHMGESIRKQDVEQKRFYENVSHELKSPLTVISGYAQGIKNNIVEDEGKALEIIVQECDNVRKQLDNIIYLSKLDTVEDFFDFKEASINHILAEVLDKLQGAFVINDIDVYFEPTEDYVIKADAEKLSRAITNILYKLY